MIIKSRRDAAELVERFDQVFENGIIVRERKVSYRVSADHFFVESELRYSPYIAELIWINRKEVNRQLRSLID